MDAELKAKWVKALRSGEFERGLIHLRKGNRYCCLGVLCVAGLGIDLPSDPEAHRDEINIAYEKIRPALGTYKISTLTNMNDCEDKSFSAIADYLEANP